MSDAEGKPRPGRTPGGPSERILAVARQLFFSEGVAEVTTDKLAKAANTSKTTIYKYFGDMDGLLREVIEREGNTFFDGVALEAQSRAEFLDALKNYGSNLLEFLNRQEVQKFDLLIHEEARKRPELAELFYNSTFGRSHRQLTELIEYGQAKGFVTRSEPAHEFAEHLLVMWEGLGLVRNRLGLDGFVRSCPQTWSAKCVDTLFA